MLVRVRFLSSRVLLDERRLPAEVYEAGHEYDLRPDQAQRWIRRQAAIEVPMPEPEPVVELAPEPVPEPVAEVADVEPEPVVALPKFGRGRARR